MKPLKPRMTKQAAWITIVIIWLTGGLLSLPNLLYSSTITIRYGDGYLRTLCFLRWPDGPNVISKLDYSYNVIILVVTYVLPISAMSFTYLKIGRELWGSTYIGECCDKQIANIKSKKRVVRMFIVVVTIFAICWLPYHVYFIYIAHHKEVISFHYIQHVYLVIYWLAMSSSMYNPIIYVKMNARFRKYFLTVLKCCRQPSATTICGQSVTCTNANCHSMSERKLSIRRPTLKSSLRSNGYCNGSKKGSLTRTSFLSNSSKRSYMDQKGNTNTIPENSYSAKSRLKSWFRRPNPGVTL